MKRGGALRLGCSLLRAGGRRVWLSRVMVFLGVVLAVVGSLVVFSAAKVPILQAERAAARAFLIPHDGEEILGYFTESHMPYDNDLLYRFDVDPKDERLPLPPGLKRWPAPGEVILSPAAKTLHERNADFRAYVPGRASELWVEDEGLRRPNELVAYRGVSRDSQDRGGMRVGATGLSALGIAPPNGQQIAGLTCLVALLLAIPSVSFLVVASRLSSAARGSRLLSLHFLGASARTLRLVNAVEMSVLSFLGWSVGILLYPAVNTVVAGSGILGTVWFADDTALTPVAIALTGVCVLLWFAWTMRRTKVDTSFTRATVRQSDQTKSRTLWVFFPLAVGVTSLIGQVIAGAMRPAGVVLVRGDIVMISSVLVCVFSFVLALPSLVRAVGTILSRRGRSLAARIGGARAAYQPRAGAALVGALSLFVMISGITIGQTKDARAVSQPVTPYVSVFVDTSELPAGAARRIRASLDRPSFALVNVSEDVSQAKIVAIGACGEIRDVLRRLSASDFAECREGNLLVSLLPRGEQVDEEIRLSPEYAGDFADKGKEDVKEVLKEEIRKAPLLSSLQLSEASSGILPQDLSRVLHEGGIDGLITADPQAVLDSVKKGPTVGSDGSVTYRNEATLVFSVSRDEVNHVHAVIYENAPYSQPQASNLDPASGQNIALINGFIRLGLILGSGMTIVALITGIIDRAASRRGADYDMLLAGAPRGFLRSIHRWEITVTMIAGAAVALALGLIGGLAWQYMGGLDRTPDWGAMGVLTVIVAGVIVLTVQCVALCVPRTIDPDQLRAG